LQSFAKTEYDGDYCFCFITENMHVKPKKSKSQITKKLIPPLQLDATGRPVFPLVLGELTIHSIGEVKKKSP